MTATQPVIVLGGTGFVGEGLARRWRPADGQLTFLVHRSRPAWLDELGVSSVSVDLSSPDSIRSAATGARTAINLLRPIGDGWYPTAMETVLPAMAAAGIVRFVHASSIDVYNGSDAVEVTAATPAVPVTPYEMEHVDTERRSRNTFGEPVILRLGAVFGAGGRNVVALADEMSQASRYKLALRRSLYGSRRMHLVNLQTVCGALEAAARSEKPVGLVVNVTDDSFEENNFGFVQDVLAAAFGRPGLGSIPAAPPSALGMMLRLRGLNPVLARRRFASDGLMALSAQVGDFVSEIQGYARYLARQVQGR